jgi:DNA-binding transcriptional ArsR family regulator
MDELLAGLRAIAETTRLRLLFALSHGEFNVSELTQILGQSQPRVSRHLKLMTEAGLLSRYKEGSWVLFRLREEDLGGAVARSIVSLLPGQDELLSRDLSRMEGIRKGRAEAAQRYFGSNAANWAEMRSLHVREEDVEAAILRALAGARAQNHVDLGTGTGRILQLLAPLATQSVGLDSSRDMLSIARAALEQAALKHVQVRHGDLYALPFANEIS